MSMTEDQGATGTVGYVLAEGLARAGVRIAFTVPGESVLGLLEGLAANRVRVVAARHEGAAAFMAEAVAQLTGRPALCVAARGPGAANLAIGLHAAQADSAPVIAVVGQVSSDVRGREAFQEMDVVRAFEPIVKWAAELRDPADARPMIERAIATATRGRPGPVVLAVPADMFDAGVAGEPGQRAGNHAEHHAEPDPTLVRKVLHLLADARRPLILAGAGVLRARSTDALVRFAETMRVPVVASWRRADVFPNDNPLYLGMTGLGAPPTVFRRLEEADAVLVMGSRLGEITTYGYRIPGPSAKWAHIDVEPRSGASAHRPDIAMAADAAAFLRVAQRVLARAAFDAASLDERTAANAADREAYELARVVDAVPWSGPGIHPGRIVATLSRVLPPDSIITTDAGDFGTWAARGYRFHRPGTFIASTAGPMGFGLPAAIGATLARPGRLGVALAGDGSFAMTMAELETAVRERAHVIVLVFDNGRYGTTWRHQEERAAGAGLGTRLGSIDFAGVAAACGVVGLYIATDDEFEPALRQAIEGGRPALLHLAMDPAWTTPDFLPVVGSAQSEAAEAAEEVEVAEAAEVALELALNSATEERFLDALQDIITEAEIGEEAAEVVEADAELELAIEEGGPGAVPADPNAADQEDPTRPG
jgi:acetolactate synthase-1/2/3 large subunit